MSVWEKDVLGQEVCLRVRCDVTPMWFKGWEAELKHSVLDRNACLAAPTGTAAAAAAAKGEKKGHDKREQPGNEEAVHEDDDKKNTRPTENKEGICFEYISSH